ncbi:MAG: hypothetical protein ACP5QO_15675, partial [Clostridia bacterium]
HAGFADESAGFVSIENSPERVRLETIDLTARVPESRQFEHCFLAENKTGCEGKVEERDAFRRDVLVIAPGWRENPRVRSSN